MSTPITVIDQYGNETTLDRIFKVDSFNHLVITDSNEHRIEGGKAYTAEHNADGSSGTKATISFTTPDTSIEIHLLVTMRANVESFYTFGEGASMGVAGSDYAPRNRNRRSGNTTSLLSADGAANVKGQLTLGGTVSDFGTVLETLHIGIGKQGGESRDIREWVLKPNTVYALEVESEAASSEVTIEIHYYEEEV